MTGRRKRWAMCFPISLLLFVVVFVGVFIKVRVYDENHN